jgi:hypothetical protein
MEEYHLPSWNLDEVFEKIPRADERHVAREIDMRVLLLLGLPTTGENMTGFSAPMSINESGSSNNNEKGKQKVHKGSKNLQAAEKKPPQKAVAKNAPEISPANGGLAGKKELVIKYKTPAEAFIENGYYFLFNKKAKNQKSPLT